MKSSSRNTMPPEWLGNMELVPTSNTPQPQAQAQLTPGAASASATAGHHLLYVNMIVSRLPLTPNTRQDALMRRTTFARLSTRHNSQLSLGEGWRAARGLGAENGRKHAYDAIATTEMRDLPRSVVERGDRGCWSWCGA